MIWLLPLPFALPLPLSPSVSPTGDKLTEKERQIGDGRESLVLYKSFNTISVGVEARVKYSFLVPLFPFCNLL
jgi:hypothetical protein